VPQRPHRSLCDGLTIRPRPETTCGNRRFQPIRAHSARQVKRRPVRAGRSPRSLGSWDTPARPVGCRGWMTVRRARVGGRACSRCCRTTRRGTVALSHPATSAPQDLRPNSAKGRRSSPQGCAGSQASRLGAARTCHTADLPSRDHLHAQCNSAVHGRPCQPCGRKEFGKRSGITEARSGPKPSMSRCSD